MRREVEYTEIRTEYFCDKCGAQIFDHRCTCETCGSDFCEQCRHHMDSHKACEFCPPEFIALDAENEAIWDKANNDAQKIWNKKRALLDRLREEQRLTAAERGVHADKG